MNGCTVLLIYIITNNYQKLNNNLINNIWQVAKHNFLKAKSKSLTTLNSQLGCVLLWNSVSITVSQAQNDNLL